MALSKEDVKHIAHLARLQMNDAEIGKFTGQLSGILEHAESLKEVNTDGVEPISQITGLTNMTFEDDVDECGFEEGLLEQSPSGTTDRMIKVKNVFN